MLLLKLLLVPFFLGAISLAGKRFGPDVAGWLAGMPVVVGPILLLLALQNGPAFAGGAAVFTLASVFTVIAFGVSYSWAAQRWPWWGALGAGLTGWLASALIVASVDFTLVGATALAACSLVAAPWLYPRVVRITTPAPLPHGELLLRMGCGAALTLLVTTVSQTVGTTWSGIASLAPVLTPVIAVFMHRGGSSAHAITMLSALARGLYSLAAFCLVIAWQLTTLGTLKAFLLGVVVALVVQGFSLLLRRRSERSKDKPANT